jgi:hypothetical protein
MNISVGQIIPIRNGFLKIVGSQDNQRVNPHHKNRSGFVKDWLAIECDRDGKYKSFSQIQQFYTSELEQICH